MSMTRLVATSMNAVFPVSKVTFAGMETSACTPTQGVLTLDCYRAVDSDPIGESLIGNFEKPESIQGDE
jgi:hypothetical protein